MTFTKPNFVAKFPQFKDKNPAILDLAIALAEPYVPIKVWGNQQVNGLNLMVAHILDTFAEQLAVVAGVAQNLTSGSTVSFPSLSAAKDDPEAFFRTTMYGLQFLALKSQLDNLRSLGLLGEEATVPAATGLATGFAF